MMVPNMEPSTTIIYCSTTNMGPNMEVKYLQLSYLSSFLSWFLSNGASHWLMGSLIAGGSHQTDYRVSTHTHMAV